MKICFITVSSPAIKVLTRLGDEINEEYGSILDLKIFNASRSLSLEERSRMAEDIRDGDFLFLDLMGASPDLVMKIESSLSGYKGDLVPYGNSLRAYMKLGSFVPDEMDKGKMPDMKSMKKMKDVSEKIGKYLPGKMKDMRNYSLMMKYFKLGDYENIKNMVYLILKDYGGYKCLPDYGEPVDLEDVSLCDPTTMTFYKNFLQFKRVKKLDWTRPNIVVLFYGHKYPNDTSQVVADIVGRLEGFANVYPVAICNSFLEGGDKLKDLLLKGIGVKIDLILNFMSFRLGAGPMGGDSKSAIELLETINVPYLHPFIMSSKKEEDWIESIQGASSSEVMISVMLPELDGAIEIFPIAAMGEEIYSDKYKVATRDLKLIEERADRLVEKIKAYLNLRKKENKDKKIAIISYNYPPGEANIFGGAFLDSFKSISRITEKLQEEGYKTSGLSDRDLKEAFTGGRLLNGGRYGDYSQDLIRYNSKDYEEYLRSLKDKDSLEGVWGQSPGNIMTQGDDFLIPGLVDGNVFIGLQPSKGDNDEIDYHNRDSYPHHQYLAFYKWIRDEFKADAIIHVGTHGTLEFQRGKECGMSGACYPDILLASIPHYYIYYCGNPSESTIAKRRSYGNIVSYQPPVFSPGDLYGNYSKLTTLVDNYRQLASLSQSSAKSSLDEIFKLAKELNLEEDLDLIEMELYNMKTSLIPNGLHILGEAYSEAESITYGKGILRHSIGQAKSLTNYLAEEEGLDLSKLFDQGNYEKISQIDDLADEIFENYMLTGDLDETWPQELVDILNYGKLASLNSRENFELQGLINNLAGLYNPVKLSGDIYRNPDILPTGFGLYQFDPRLVPTMTAYKRGEKIADNTIEAYLNQEGLYPNSTAVVLWGIETSRTQGESLCQILSYLGVRLKSSAMNWEPKYEIIPIEELKRPRIDVTINICGFFRDMFPNLIDSLSDIFFDLYNLDEGPDENYFKANSDKIYKYLIGQGYGSEEAMELAISRIFGPQEGQYGSGITDIIESRNWQDEEELGNNFINNLQYAYNRNIRGKKVDRLYEENLKSVDIVSQLRSSNEYEIIDLDHYYEFFGGLAKSVELVRGKKAKMYITDVTRDHLLTESLDKSIERGIRTRLLNPKWIDSLLEHDRHGAQEIGQRFENIMGLAATTGEVSTWVYWELNEKYVRDEDLRKRLIENNKYAYLEILEHMIDYSNRDYWPASEEDLAYIKSLYLQVEGLVEDEI